MNQGTRGDDSFEVERWRYVISPAHSWEYLAGDAGKNVNQNLEKPKPFESETSQQYDVSRREISPVDQSQLKEVDRRRSQGDCMSEFDLVEIIQRPQRTEWKGVSLVMPESTRDAKTTEIGPLVGRDSGSCDIVERSPLQIDGVWQGRKMTEVETQG